MTQKDKIYNHLKLNSGEWVSGTIFNFNMMISQYHTRIHELQKQGHKIEASTFTDENGFKSYRLILDTPICSSQRPKTATGEDLDQKLKDILSSIKPTWENAKTIAIINKIIKSKSSYNKEQIIKHYEQK